MHQDTTALRELIAKWFGHGNAPHLRITRLHGPGLERGCIRAELANARQPLAIVFFRHQAGCWRIFPPTHVRGQHGNPMR